VYVKEQMGHSSIQVTVDLYGHLIPDGNKQAVDRLDGPVEKSVEIGQSATQPQPRYSVPIKKPSRNVQQGLKNQPLMLVAGARFCHYFTPSIRIPLLPEEGKSSNKTRFYLKIPA
jgi:hypothetical protein